MDIPEDGMVKHAVFFLNSARETIDSRRDTYDSAKMQGERSMRATVDAFNIITRREGERALTEAEGWLLMQILKDVRQWSATAYHHDSALDGVAYAALKAEALAR